MNWLAHLALSPPTIHFQMGNLCADIVRRPFWESAPEEALAGVQLHGMIDAFTDGHPVVARSKARLGAHGRLRSVVVDLVYDHFLAAEWTPRIGGDLDGFLSTFFCDAADVLSLYPDRVSAFVTTIEQTGRLGSYRTLDGIGSAMTQLDHRLSDRIRAKECTLDYFPQAVAASDGLREDFAEFFPDLQEAVATRLARSPEGLRRV